MEQNGLLPFQAWPPRRVAAATVVVILLASAFYLLVEFRLVFFLLFTAIVLSTAVSPLVDQLERLKIPRALSIILIAVVIFAAILLLTFLIGPLIAEQGATIASLLSSWYQQGHQAMIESPSLLIRRIARQLPAVLPLTMATPPPGEQPNPMDMIQQAMTIISMVVNNIVTIGAVVLLAGVWILEGERTGRFLLMAFPASRRDNVREFLSEAGAKVGAYTRGLAILSTVIGVMSLAGYLLIGLPNVLLLAILAGIFELVPLVGPLLAAIPALLVAVSVDPSKVIPVIIATVVIQFLENNFVAPRVMDRAVGVNPIASLLAFLGFGALFGFVGALLAIPLAAIIQITLNRLVFDARAAEQSTPLRRDSVSKLRYETQDLVFDIRKQVRDKESELEAKSDQIEDSIEAIAQDLDSILALIETRNQENAARRAP